MFKRREILLRFDAEFPLASFVVSLRLIVVDVGNAFLVQFERIPRRENNA